MSKEQDLYNWCCLQTLLYKAGLLDEEQKEKLVELFIEETGLIIDADRIN